MPGTPRDIVVKSKQSPGSGPVALRQLNPTHKKVLRIPENLNFFNPVISKGPISVQFKSNKTNNKLL